MSITINEKPVVEPKRPSQLEELKVYRVVSVRENYNQVEVGDIVLRFRSSGCPCIMNCTKQEVMYSKDRFDNFGCNAEFTAERAFNIQSIVFAVDNEDRP